MGAAQLILTSRLDGPSGRASFGKRGQVVRTGVDIRPARQAWALLAAPLALGRGPVDVVHGHCGEDIAVQSLARLAARRHRCPPGHYHPRQRAARHAGHLGAHGVAAAGRRPGRTPGLAAADMVIALTAPAGCTTGSRTAGSG